MVTFEGNTKRPSFIIRRDERSKSVKRPSPSRGGNYLKNSSLMINPMSPLEIVKNKILRMRAVMESKRKIIRYDRENSHEFLNIIHNKIKE